MLGQAARKQLGSQGIFSPSPRTTPHAGPHGAVPLQVLESIFYNICTPMTGFKLNADNMAPPIGFIALSSPLGSFLLAKVRPFTISRPLRRALG